MYLPHRAESEHVHRMVSAALRQGATLVYPSHVILDVYQKVRSDNKSWIRRSRPLTQDDTIGIKRMAWDYVNQMQEIATAIPSDHVDIHLACKLRDNHDDLEDDLVLAACQRAKANYLVTNDESLLKHAPLEAHTPAQMLELLLTGRAKGNAISREVAGSSDWFYRWLEMYAKD